MHKSLIESMGANDEGLYIADSFPIPAHINSRAHFSKNFKAYADYGYCASKEGIEQLI